MQQTFANRGAPAASTSHVNGHSCCRCCRWPPYVPAVYPDARNRRQTVVPLASASSNNNSNGAAAPNELQWLQTAFPSYLQSEADEFCDSWEDQLQEKEDQQPPKGASNAKQGKPKHASHSEAVWQTIRKEAQADAAKEPLLSSFLYFSILSHHNFEHALAFVLSNRLSDATMLATELFEIFHDVLSQRKEVADAALADCIAVRERDPACKTYCAALLYYKGFHALQVHRIANCLWRNGRRVLALALQSRCSEVFAVDIHPAARIGRGILLDHGTGVVIGETAVVGSNVSLMQNVTLGGTGKDVGDRHPKISDNVLVGAGATILGNISVGKGSQVAAGSLVLKPVPPRTMVAGSPAKEVGRVTGNPALKMEHWIKPINAEDLLYGPSPATRKPPTPPQPSHAIPTTAPQNAAASASEPDQQSLSSTHDLGGATGAGPGSNQGERNVSPKKRQGQGSGSQPKKNGVAVPFNNALALPKDALKVAPPSASPGSAHESSGGDSTPAPNAAPQQSEKAAISGRPEADASLCSTNGVVEGAVPAPSSKDGGSRATKTEPAAVATSVKRAVKPVAPLYPEPEYTI